MAMLIVAAAVFLFLHFIVAGTRLRDAVVAAVGEQAYLGAFSLASVGGKMPEMDGVATARASGTCPGLSLRC